MKNKNKKFVFLDEFNQKFLTHKHVTLLYIIGQSFSKRIQLPQINRIIKYIHAKMPIEATPP
jgi:hypothetical protein